jgi:hypothetical protein
MKYRFLSQINTRHNRQAYQIYVKENYEGLIWFGIGRNNPEFGKAPGLEIIEEACRAGFWDNSRIRVVFPHLSD